MLKNNWKVIFVAFHDCIGPNGCDGCINTNNSGNTALNPLIELLVMKREQQFKVDKHNCKKKYIQHYF